MNLLGPRSFGGFAAFASCVSLAAALTSACSSEPAESMEEESTASEALGVDAGTTARTVCTATSTATTQALSLVSHVPCKPSLSRACPANLPVLEATSAASAQGDTTSTWSVKSGGQLPMSATVHVVGNVTTTSTTYGTALTGVQHAQLTSDGHTYTGNVDGRAIVPINLATYHRADGLKLADGLPLPPITTNKAQLEAIYALLEQAGKDTPASCAAGSSAELSRITHVVAAAESALLQNIPSATPKFSTRAALGTQHPPALAMPMQPQAAVQHAASGTAQGTATGTANPGVVLAAPSNLGAAQPGPKANSDGTNHFQNSPLDWITPNCQQCETDCIDDPLGWITLGVLEFLCNLSCFEPGHGCAQTACSFGDSCDNNETCCGDLCCAAGHTCGNDQFGACCPADNPVGCGDSTGVTCFPAGTTCCGDLEFGCSAGYACVNVTGLTASCCPSGQMASDGQCCSHALCNGQCCGQGEACVNGSCCAGPQDKNGACCGALSAVCNGACCDGACGSQGQCCPTGFPNCGAPPSGVASLLFWDSRTNTGSTGSIVCNGTPCMTEDWWNTFTVHGAGYQAGVPVTVTVAGAEQASWTAMPDASGTFTLDLAPGGLGARYSAITATQHASNGVRSASLMASFIDRPM